MINLFFVSFILSVLLCLNCPNPYQFVSSGSKEIDATRKEVQVSETRLENVKERRATLYRFWRLLWHQGYDMDAFDSEAETLLNFSDSSYQGQQAITSGFMKLEQMMRIGKKVSQIRGQKSSDALINEK